MSAWCWIIDYSPSCLKSRCMLIHAEGKRWVVSHWACGLLPDRNAEDSASLFKCLPGMQNTQECIFEDYALFGMIMWHLKAALWAENVVWLVSEVWCSWSSWWAAVQACNLSLAQTLLLYSTWLCQAIVVSFWICCTLFWSDVANLALLYMTSVWCSPVDCVICHWRWWAHLDNWLSIGMLYDIICICGCW